MLLEQEEYTVLSKSLWGEIKSWYLTSYMGNAWLDKNKQIFH